MQTFLVIPKAQRQKMSRLRVKRIERERTDLSSAEEMVRLFQGKTIIVFFFELLTGLRLTILWAYQY